ncbi:DNA-binding protein [Pseudomonas viridiflava]|uniref:DNA-binding protein n=1 Tax=Pseudomonas viridiflava TaxID=33069 RepID=UPI001F14D4C0|nr:DNA-binding protein [Pseudomonas viridiflava]
MLKSPKEAKLWLPAQGISITEFARDHGLDLGTIYQVLQVEKNGFEARHISGYCTGYKSSYWG